ncbi:MAG: hypothetical protein ACOC2C_06750 [Cyclonatronaceae bacterium]
MISSFWASLPRHRRVFLSIAIFVQLSIIWPGFALMSAAEPLVFGLPLSFAWLIAMLLLGFAALLMLYFGDNRQEEAAASSGDAAAMPSPEITAPHKNQPRSGDRNKNRERSL